MKKTQVGYAMKFRGAFDLKFKNKSQAKKIKIELEDLDINWIIEDDQLKWNGSDVCDNYLEHLKDVLENIFNRNNVGVEGEVRWLGEDMGDNGVIYISDGVMSFNSQNKKLHGTAANVL